MDFIISVLLYLVVLYFSINLLGLFVRGLFVYPEIEKLKRHEFLKEEIEKHEKADKKINIIALILIIVFYYSLVHFWNFGVAIAAVMIMLGRLKDLIWEIKNGKRMTKENIALQKRDLMFYVSASLPWLAFPVLYYFLNYYK